MKKPLKNLNKNLKYYVIIKLYFYNKKSKNKNKNKIINIFYNLNKLI